MHGFEAGSDEHATPELLSRPLHRMHTGIVPSGCFEDNEGKNKDIYDIIVDMCRYMYMSSILLYRRVGPRCGHLLYLRMKIVEASHQSSHPSSYISTSIFGPLIRSA